MAYDEGLAERVRDVLDDEPGLAERKMFGGLCFTVDGNMVCGIVGDDLMVRVGADGWAEALDRPHAREMDFTGRSMRGFVFVGEAGVAEDDDLLDWVGRARRFVATLPPK